MTDRTLTTDEQVLAHATKQAIRAAGGLEICARETGLSDSQLSRCCSPNLRDSISIRDVATISAISHGKDGHPHILHALARVIGGHVVIALPDASDDPQLLSSSVLELAVELGDVSGAIRDAMSERGAGGEKVLPGEAATALDCLDKLDRASARLRHQLTRIASGSPPPTN